MARIPGIIGNLCRVAPARRAALITWCSRIVKKMIKRDWAVLGAWYPFLLLIKNYHYYVIKLNIHIIMLIMYYI